MVSSNSSDQYPSKVTMTVKIESKIKGYSVVNPDAKSPAPVETPPPEATVIAMHEGIERPEVLPGKTYKIKSPLVEHAIYITINDIVLNEGTPHEVHRPFEIFINSKSMEHFQWIVATTRILSAVFRKGGDVKFLIDEMKAVFDPKGGYYKSGGVYMPSIIAEIGFIIETHLESIGMLVREDKGAAARAMLAEKVAAKAVVETSSAGEDGAFPSTATVCGKCNVKALVLMDGCATCLNCGHSKCG